MEKQAPRGLGPAEGLAGTGSKNFASPSGTIRELPCQKAPQQEGTPHCLGSQWQDFLKTMQPPSTGLGNPHLPELETWDDPVTFEREFGDCQWPSEDRRTQLLPAFSAEAQQAFTSLNSSDEIDYGEVKALFLQGNSTSTEIHRKRFRQFCYQEAEGPREACSQLRELCHCWLEPKSHTKEQILELLILEQFLIILPEDIQSQVRGRSPQTCAQAVALAEGFILRQQEEQGPEPFPGVAVDFSEAQKTLLDARQRQHGRKARRQDNGAKIVSQAKEQFEHQESRVEEALPAPERTQKKKTHLCTECGKNFNRPSGLAKHLYVHTGEKPYLCAECGKGFSQLPHLKRHLNIHSGEKPHLCSECGNTFSQRTNLVSHQRSHSGERPYRCSYCQKCFSQQSVLKIHERNHMGQKPYVCAECGKQFASSSSLTTHWKIHTGEKPHACEVCGKRFIQRSNLVSHQRSHTGEKPFSCTVCGRRFAYPSDLTRHQKIHTGEKPYPCDKCERRFSRLSDLIGHQRLHTGEKPYHCLECGKRFTQRGVLVKHQKSHSKENPRGREAIQPPASQSNHDLRVHEIKQQKEELENLANSGLIPSPDF